MPYSTLGPNKSGFKAANRWLNAWEPSHATDEFDMDGIGECLAKGFDAIKQCMQSTPLLMIGNIKLGVTQTRWEVTFLSTWLVAASLELPCRERRNI